MPFVLQALIDFWRQRLLQIDERLAIAHYDSWRLQLERRVIRFFLQRHSDSPSARPPSRAAALDAESHQRSNRLFLRSEVKERLNGHVANSYSELEFEPPPKKCQSARNEINYGQPNSLEPTGELNYQLILLTVLCILLLIDILIRLN